MLKSLLFVGLAILLFHLRVYVRFRRPDETDEEWSRDDEYFD